MVICLGSIGVFQQDFEILFTSKSIMTQHLIGYFDIQINKSHKAKALTDHVNSIPHDACTLFFHSFDFSKEVSITVEFFVRCNND